mmetsp:Transcript_4666/g.12446  ORF Transcript_4666/g.12446 Transcript_4666/m.12446 type:complete len:226 (-) Transcript_4666:403-1080(-)
MDTHIQTDIHTHLHATPRYRWIEAMDGGENPLDRQHYRQHAGPDTQVGWARQTRSGQRPCCSDRNPIGFCFCGCCCCCCRPPRSNLSSLSPSKTGESALSSLMVLNFHDRHNGPPRLRRSSACLRLFSSRTAFVKDRWSPDRNSLDDMRTVSSSMMLASPFWLLDTTVWGGAGLAPPGDGPVDAVAVGLVSLSSLASLGEPPPPPLPPRNTSPSAVFHVTRLRSI